MKRSKIYWIFNGWGVYLENSVYDGKEYQFLARSDVDGLNFTIDDLYDTIETLQQLKEDYWKSKE